MEDYKFMILVVVLVSGMMIWTAMWIYGIWQQDKMIKINKKTSEVSNITRAKNLYNPNDTLESSFKDISVIVNQVIDIYYKVTYLNNISVHDVLYDQSIDIKKIDARTTSFNRDEDVNAIHVKVLRRVSKYLLARLELFINKNEISEYIKEYIIECNTAVADSLMTRKRMAYDDSLTCIVDTKKPSPIVIENKKQIDAEIVKIQQDILSLRKKKSPMSVIALYETELRKLKHKGGMKQ